MTTTYTAFTSSSQFISVPSICWHVHLLSAPLSILHRGVPRESVNNLIEAQLLHFGLGLQSTSDSLSTEFTFDYDLVSGNPLDAVLPTVSGSTLTWNNSASVYIGSNIDRTYWYSSVYIATIDNDTLVRWQQSILSYGTSNPVYTTLSLTSPPVTRSNIFSPFVRSSTSSDFANSMLLRLASLQAPISYVTAPFINVSTLSVNEREVIVTDPTQDVVDYYSDLRDSLSNVPAIEILLAEIAAVPAGAYDLLITLYNELVPLLVDTIQQIEAVIAGTGGIVYIYTYIANSSTSSTLVYYSVFDPAIYVDYIQSNLLRSYSATGTNGRTVNDGYTNTLIYRRQQCCTSPLISVGSTVDSDWEEVFIIVAIILVALILFIWLASSGRRG